MLADLAASSARLERRAARERIATAALAALVTRGVDDTRPEVAAVDAVAYADALLATLYPTDDGGAR